MKNNTNIHFDTQDAKGDEGVASLTVYLTNRGWTVEEAPKRYHPEWDVRATDGVADDPCQWVETYESKREPDATGYCNMKDLQYKYNISYADAKVHPERTYENVFVEYMEKGRPSGIALTEATYYWLDNGAGYFKVPTGDLKKLAREGRCGIKGGNNGTALGCLVKIGNLTEYKVEL